MSQETAAAEETEEGTSVLELWRTWYDVVGLAGVMLFMLWVRLQSRDNFIRGDEVLFSGNDAFYHFREISYTVNNYPWTMPFDPWTRYPQGTSVGQFGTLFDQLIATAALIVGLGDPSSRQVALVTLVAPAVFGALVALPVYYTVRRFHGRGTGLFAAALLALIPGTFFRRSTVGFADHHVAETLFMAVAVLATMAALGVAERERPVYEQLLDRDWEGLKRPVGYSAVAGFAVFLYLWVWPPGVVLVGIFGVFYTVALSADVLKGRSPEHVAQVGIVSMTVTAVLSLLRVADLSFSATDPSLLQPVLALAVAGWCGSLAAAARLWNDEDLSERAYPAAVAGTIVVGIGLIAVALPSLYNTLVSQSLRAFGFGQSDTVLTIAEAQAAPGIAGGFDVGTLNSFLFAQYGLAYVVALLGLVWMTFRAAYTEYRAEYVLLVVWSTFLWLMALTQTRFNYYLVLSVVVMTAWVFGHVVDAVNLGEMTGRIGDIKPYQVITVVAVFMLVFAPLLPPLAATSGGAGGQPAFVVDAGSGFGPGAVTGWTGTGDWMNENTPKVGNYGDATNADEFPYYGTYPRTDDYDYPDGAYGVMSWWDYGHWITVLAERPPHANPFQQNARSASSFLQASSEERANAVLDALPAVSGSGGQFDEMTTEELRALGDGASGDGEGVRYVVIDDQTAGEKFAAVAQWSVPPDNRGRLARQNRDPTGTSNQGLYFDRQQYQLRGQNETLPVVSDRYRETMLAKLYLQDANGLEHYRLVHESSQYSIVGGVVQPNGRVAPRTSTRLPGEGWSQDRANDSRQLDFARRQGAAVPTQQGGAFYDASLEAAVKTFERVDGATITGQVAGSDENASVVAYVELETSTGRQFAYQQWVDPDEDGSFEVTVPYATDDTVGPDEGGTNTSVTAVTDYQIKVADSRIRGLIRTARIPNAAQTAVPETAVYGGETVSVGTISPPSPGDGNESDGDGQGDGAVTPAPAPAVSPGIASGADGGAPPSPVTVTATAEPTG